jgi:RND family efflux transporter MFP subunit
VRSKTPLFAALAVTLALTHCAQQDAAVTGAGNESRSNLRFVAAEVASAPRELVFDGVLEAVNQSTVSAQTSGRIVELTVDVDSTVRKGDVIARLRDTEPRARLDAADAAQREAQAQLTRTQAEYARAKAEFDAKYIAQAQMDIATAARDAAQARLAQTRAALDDAREQQDYALVRAPYAGIVTARHVQIGELAVPGRALVTMLSLDKLRAVADVPQQFIGALRDGGQARVTFPDGDTLAAGSIHIFPYADEHSHTFRVRVDLPEAGPHTIYPGELVKLAFDGPAVNTLSVPAAALAWRGEVAGLYVAEAQRTSPTPSLPPSILQFRAVRVGRSLPGQRIEILSGLTAGESVALDPIAAANAMAGAPGSL